MHRHTHTAQETTDFGGQLARAHPRAEGTLTVLYLAGDLGAGKTTFAGGFLRALGVHEPVRSPTYTLVELYPLGGRICLHVDLYRLRAPEELATLGLREWARPGCLWLIEWPEKGAGHLPPPDLTLRFAVGAAGHHIEVDAASALGRAWLGQVPDESRGGSR